MDARGADRDGRFIRPHVAGQRTVADNGDRRGIPQNRPPNKTNVMRGNVETVRGRDGERREILKGIENRKSEVKQDKKR